MAKPKQIPAVILARGGSKGIKHKNLQDLWGKTLIGRCVEEAVASPFDPVFVYSDSAEIRYEGQKAGGCPVERPAEVSGDCVSSETAIKRFLDDRDPDATFRAIALIQCTTPFLTRDHMTSVYQEYRRGDWDSVVTVTPQIKYLGYEKFNRHTMFIPLQPYRDLRQEACWGQYLESGGVYLAERQLWIAGRRIGEKCGIVKMGWWESMEIDEPFDLDIARALAPLFFEKGSEDGEEEEAQTGYGQTFQCTRQFNQEKEQGQEEGEEDS